MLTTLSTARLQLGLLLLCYNHHRLVVNGGRSLTKANEAYVPDTVKCCRSKGVSQLCVKELCNVHSPPNEFEVFEVASECPQWLPSIASCLVDERDHSGCCRRQAKGSDDLSCLHLCNGTETAVDLSRWEEYKAYVTCLSFNIQPMYQCFLDGYRRNPFPPVHLTAISVQQRRVEIRWKPPMKHAHLVKQYRVLCRTSDQLFVKEGVTTNTFLIIDDLLPNTQYSITALAEGDSREIASLPSEELIVLTEGDQPEVRAYQREIETADKYRQTIICRIKIHGRQKLAPNVVWSRRYSKVEKYHEVKNSQRHSDNVFLSLDQGRWMIYTATLTVHSVESEDYAYYKCDARTPSGQGEAEVRLRSMHTVHIPDNPPNVTKCCHRENVHSACLNLCKGHMLDLDIAGIFLADLQVHRCSRELPKMIGCSLGNTNYGACCMRRQVPDGCLAFCDPSLRLPVVSDAYASCLPHLTSVMECHMESRELVPPPPDNLRLVNDKAIAETSATIEWNQVVSAKLYIVYYRSLEGAEENDHWERRSSTTSAIVLNQLVPQARFQVVVLAANLAGSSEASRSLFFTTMPKKKKK